MNKTSKNNDLLRKNNMPQTCRSCLYRNHRADDGEENCFRFARFVDHRIHETSRDCDYWSPASSHP